MVNHHVNTYRAAGLEARWGKFCGAPFIFVRDPAGTHPENWYAVTGPMFALMRKVGVRNAFAEFTAPNSEHKHKVFIDPTPNKIKTTAMPSFTPEILEQFAALGFNREKMLVGAEKVTNDQHPSLFIERPATRYPYRCDSNHANRYALDCDHSQNKSRRASEQPIPRLIVDVSRPRWTQTALAWLTAAAFKLPEMNAVVDQRWAAQAKIERERDAAVAPLRGPIPREDWEAIASHSFSNDAQGKQFVTHVDLRYHLPIDFPKTASVQKRAEMAQALITCIRAAGFMIGNK